MTVGERIRAIRESKGIAQCKLANDIHISPSFLNRIEKGSSVPSLECVCNVAKALQVTPQEVLCDIFIYPEGEPSTSEKIKITVEKFSPERQLILLETLEFLASRLK